MMRSGWREALVGAMVILAGVQSPWAQRGDKGFANAVVVAVAPAGNDAAAGTLQAPFRTLERAQDAVRQLNSEQDVKVLLADGVYRLEKPLVFTAKDGGRNGHHVWWNAMEGAHPVISGAVPVMGWTLFDAKRKIYVADTPLNANTRQLWVNDELSRNASIEVPRSQVEFTRQGIVLKDEKYAYLAGLPEQDRIEASSTGFFTKRISPVEKVVGKTLVMKQPAWDNNIWGYDTFNTPYHPELSH